MVCLALGGATRARAADPDRGSSKGAGTTALFSYDEEDLEPGIQVLQMEESGFKPRRRATL